MNCKLILVTTLIQLATGLAASLDCSASVSESSKSSAQVQSSYRVDVGRFRLQSNPWINLKERLYNEIRQKAPPPAGLTPKEADDWRKAVDAYRKHLGNRSPIFDDGLIKISAALSNAKDLNLPNSIPSEAGSPLRSAMTIYARTQWPEDDRANRFWIAVAKALLESAGGEMADLHSKAYGVPFPTEIDVDVSALAGDFGGYTVGSGKYAHVTLSSTTPGFQSFAALEMLGHEPSHSIVEGNSGAIGSELNEIGGELGVKPKRNLWHAILFYTSGDIARPGLARFSTDQRRGRV